VYLVLAWGVAFLSEFSATRNGFPFGRYVYIDDTRTRELWISNVPFWDSLSFVFLSYFAWRVAAAVRDAVRPETKWLEPATAVLGGFLMMLLDVVIDPVTLLGDRWFLGRIYYYPNGGPYFGVTLENFAGWWFVGTVTILLFQALCRMKWLGAERFGAWTRAQSWAAFGVYSGVFFFNLAVTAYVGAWTLFATSCGVIAVTLGACGVRLSRARPMAATMGSV
jgi:putative membrane protein